MTALASLRAQFDGVAIDITDIERAAHALGAVSLLKFAGLDSMGLQVSDQFGFIEGFDLQAEGIPGTVYLFAGRWFAVGSFGSGSLSVRDK